VVSAGFSDVPDLLGILDGSPLGWISRCLGVIQISLAFLYPENDKTARLDLKFHSDPHGYGIAF